MLRTYECYRTLLKGLLSARQERNPHYSQRAFSRDLGLNPAHLSRILSGKEGLSAAKATAISNRLSLSAEDQEYFVALVCSSDARSKPLRRSATSKVKKIRQEACHQNLDLETFASIPDWHYFAIVELIKNKKKLFCAQETALALGISVQTVCESLNRLEKSKIIRRDAGGKYGVSVSNLVLPGKCSSQRVKQFHQSLLRQAENALFQDPFEQREFSSLILSFQTKRLPEAKKFLARFMKEFDRKFGQSQLNADVYCLGLQFFKVTKEKAL